MKEKYFLWFISGGLGKNVAATSLIKPIKIKYPERKLIIVCSYPEIFLSNPNIDRVYALGHTPHFYNDYVHDKDIIICNQEPYNQTGHVKKEKHLLESWSELLNIDITQDSLPELYFNYSQQKLYNKPSSSKPNLIIQTGGGPMDDKTPYNWTRDIPIEIAQNIVLKYKTNYNIIQITKPEGYKLEGVEVVTGGMSNMKLFSLLFNSEKRILIDSCLQHAAAALKLPSTVFWIGTSPKVFGYAGHNNLVANLPKKSNTIINSALFDYQFSNNNHECPYIKIEEMFNIKEIVKNLEILF